MSNAGYSSPGDRGDGVPPVIPAQRPERSSPSALLPAVLLAVAGVLTVVSSFLTATRMTDRLHNDNAYWGDDPHARVQVVTTTAWSITAKVPIQHQQQPLSGWGFLLTGVVALAMAVLLLVGHDRWPWTRPLTALAGGVVAGWILAAVLGIVEALSGSFTDKTETLVMTPGPAILLQIPAGMLAVATAMMAMVLAMGTRPPAPSAPSSNLSFPPPPNPPAPPPTQATSAPPNQAPTQAPPAPPDRAPRNQATPPNPAAPTEPPPAPPNAAPPAEAPPAPPSRGGDPGWGRPA